MAVRPTFAPGDTLTSNNMNILANALITVNAQTGTAYTPGTAQVGQLTTVINAAGGTAVIRSAGGKLKLTTQYSVCTVLKWDTDAWVMVGNVSA